MDAGEESFLVIVEIEKPVTGAPGLEQRIEGLVGDRLRWLVRRPSEVVFANKIEIMPAGEEIADRLERPIENPAWWPGAKVLSIQAL